MSEQAGKKPGQWKLVDASTLPVQPGVKEAREVWSNKQIWVRLSSGSWRRGVVLHIGNDGPVVVKVYQRGTPGFALGFQVKEIPYVLRLADV